METHLEENGMTLGHAKAHAPPERSRSKELLDGIMIRFYERFEAAVEDLKSYFGQEAENLVSVTCWMQVGDLLMAQRALGAILLGWRIEREARYAEREAKIIERAAVETGPGSFDFMLKEGRQFWAGPGGEKFVLDVEVDEDPKENFSELRFVIPKVRHAWLVETLEKIRAWSDANHFYRGQALTGAGKFIRLEESIAWDDVILAPGLRAEIERNCIDLLARTELYRVNGIPLKRGIILHGPPGTGKTMIGKALARRCGATFILTTPGMLEDGEDVRRIFDWGRRFAPSILFFEDFDLVARNRENWHKGEILGEFLSCLDGLDAANGIVTIATTNDLKVIEPALKDRPNRFDCVLEIPPLAESERAEFLARWAERNGAWIDAARYASQTGGFTGAQLQELCRLAVFEAVEDAAREGRIAAGRIPPNDGHFRRALEKSPRKRARAIGFANRA